MTEWMMNPESHDRDYEELQTLLQELLQEEEQAEAWSPDREGAKAPSFYMWLVKILTICPVTKIYENG